LKYMIIYEYIIPKNEYDKMLNFLRGISIIRFPDMKVDFIQVDNITSMMLNSMQFINLEYFLQVSSFKQFIKFIQIINNDFDSRIYTAKYIQNDKFFTDGYDLFHSYVCGCTLNYIDDNYELPQEKSLYLKLIL
jgi:hypothetical protein